LHLEFSRLVQSTLMPQLAHWWTQHSRQLAPSCSLQRQTPLCPCSHAFLSAVMAQCLLMASLSRLISRRFIEMLTPLRGNDGDCRASSAMCHAVSMCCMVAIVAIVAIVALTLYKPVDWQARPTADHVAINITNMDRHTLVSRPITKQSCPAQEAPKP
jgi:uncharacterized membrane protein YjgN (DUF898 family)